MSQFKLLENALAPLIAAGLPLPYPLAEALKDNPLPLALSTKTAWPEWAAARGYTAEQITTLMASLKHLCHCAPYLNAMALDLSQRFDADGVATEHVSPLDRHSAALQLHGKALFKAGEGALRKAPGLRPQEAAAAETYDDRLSRPKAPAAPGQRVVDTPPAAEAATPSPPSSAPPLEPRPAPSTDAASTRAPSGRPIIGLKLSPEEIERRRHALNTAAG